MSKISTTSTMLLDLDPEQKTLVLTVSNCLLNRQATATILWGSQCNLGTLSIDLMYPEEHQAPSEHAGFVQPLWYWMLRSLFFLPVCPQVSIVGVIRGSAPFVTNIQHSVDDMTGPPFSVKQWVNAEASNTTRFWDSSWGTMCTVLIKI